jgi:diaminohydroxyphosphoribosylaminopyrimidine deaminase/5-amino-6-(5-phosphoribosylamino)uracil reductase
MDLVVVLAHLHSAQMRSVLLEAGSRLNGAFLNVDLVDEVALFYSETELGAGAVPFATGAESPFALEQRLIGVEKRTVGPDVCVSGLLHDPWRKLAVLE